MITSDRDPRDERFQLFLEEARAVPAAAAGIPERSSRLSGALGAVAEAVEANASPTDLARWTVRLAAWALSPDPVALEPWSFEALRRLRKDPVRARNVTRGAVDWTVGQLRTGVTELRDAWQAVHDAARGYPIDRERRIRHPAEASAEVAVWSYLTLRAAVSRNARSPQPHLTTLAAAARARKRPSEG